MENISWNLLFQIPLAGVVVLVVVLFLRHLKEITAAFMMAQSNQTVLFMGAIKDQREENIKATSVLTHELNNLGTLISTSLTEMKGERRKRDK